MVPANKFKEGPQVLHMEEPDWEIGHIRESMDAMIMAWGRMEVDEHQLGTLPIVVRTYRKMGAEICEQNRIAIKLREFPDVDDSVAVFFGFESDYGMLVPTIFVNTNKLEGVAKAFPKGLGPTESEFVDNLLSSTFKLPAPLPRAAIQEDRANLEQVVVRTQFRVALHLAAMYFDALINKDTPDYFLPNNLTFANSISDLTRTILSGFGFDIDDLFRESMSPQMYHEDPDIADVYYLHNNQQIIPKDDERHKGNKYKIIKQLKAWMNDPMAFIQARAFEFPRIYEGLTMHKRKPEASLYATMLLALAV